MGHLRAKGSAAMSSRARGYLVVATVHFGLIGVSMLFWPDMYRGAAYDALFQYTNLGWWGAAFTLTSVVCLIAATTQHPSYARLGLIFAFVVLTVSAFAVGWGVVSSWFDPDPALASPVVPVSFAALAVKDLLMVKQPLRTPTEDLTEAQARLEES